MKYGKLSPMQIERLHNAAMNFVDSFLEKEIETIVKDSFDRGYTKGYQEAQRIAAHKEISPEKVTRVNDLWATGALSMEEIANLVKTTKEVVVSILDPDGENGEE